MSGYFALLLVMILWGLYPIYVHYLTLQIDPLFLGGTSLIIASLPILIQLVFKKQLTVFFSKNLIKPLLAIALLGACGSALLFVGTKLTSGVNTGMLLQIEPIYSIILAAIFLNEAIKPKQIVATIIMIIGAVVIVYRGAAGFNLGDVLIFITPLFFQLSHTVSKKLVDEKINTNLILASRLYGGIMLLALSFLVNESTVALLSSEQVLTSSALLGIYLLIVLILWYEAIKRMPLVRASAFLPLTAVFSLLGAAFFLHETITLQHYIGFFFIAIGLFLLSRPTQAKSR